MAQAKEQHKKEQEKVVDLKNISKKDNNKSTDKTELPSPKIIERVGEQQDLAKLYSKLAQATGELVNIEKNGYNDYHKYKYAEADDIYLKVSKVLSEYNIAVLTSPSDKKIKKYKNSKGNVIIELLLEKYFSFNCGDTGAYVGMKYWGYDRGQGDKFLYKAYTGAMKYFLRDNFMIDTGDPDDPEFGAHTSLNSKTNNNTNNYSSKKNINTTQNDTQSKKKDKKNTKEKSKNKKSNKEKTDKPDTNYDKILKLYKDEEYRPVVKEAVQEFLVMMSNDEVSKEEVKFKNINNYSDEQLKHILDEIEERKKDNNDNK